MLPPEDDAGSDATPLGAVASDDAPRKVLISPEQFFAMFREVWVLPNRLRPKVVPLQSLVIDAGDADARAASDGLYECCLAIPWMQWILDPESVWAQRLAPVVIFSYFRLQMVRAEIAARAPVEGRVVPEPEPEPEPKKGEAA